MRLLPTVVDHSAMEPEIGARVGTLPALVQHRMAGGLPFVDWGKGVRSRWVLVDLRSTYFGIGWANFEGLH